MSVQEAPRFYRVKHDGPSPVREGVVEQLVAQGRIPQLHEVFEIERGGGSRKKIFCYVPSADTRLGDTMGFFAGMLHFKSPDGVARKFPDMFVLKPSQGARVEARIDAALGTRE